MEILFSIICKKRIEKRILLFLSKRGRQDVAIIKKAKRRGDVAVVFQKEGGSRGLPFFTKKRKWGKI